MMEVKTYRLHITGKVQGVWYRASAKDKALGLGLTGKIWNNSDNSVGAIVQGPSDNIMDFIEWCRKGPPRAKVVNVAFEEVKEQTQYDRFEIVREG